MYIQVRAAPTGLDSNEEKSGEFGHSGSAVELRIHTTSTQSTQSTSMRPQSTSEVASISTISTISSTPTSSATSSTQPQTAQAASSTSLNLLLGPSSGTFLAPDDSGLPRGAIIGITLGSIVGFVIVVFILDVLLFSSGVRRNFIRSSPNKKAAFANEKPDALPRANTITRKPLPPPEAPFYDKEIKHSRALSIDSASRYSRSTWGWSGENGGTTLRDSGEDDWRRKSVDYYRYSDSVFEEDNWEEWMEEKGRTYNGLIRPGMGVQKRYTASSFGILDQKRYTMSSFGIGEMDLDDIEEKESSRRRKFPTWIMNDPLERWRRGLHPLAGKRGDGFERIAYFK
jgi:hypothetical protein